MKNILGRGYSKCKGPEQTCVPETGILEGVEVVVRSDVRDGWGKAQKVDSGVPLGGFEQRWA